MTISVKEMTDLHFCGPFALRFDGVPVLTALTLTRTVQPSSAPLCCIGLCLNHYSVVYMLIMKVGFSFRICASCGVSNSNQKRTLCYLTALNVYQNLFIVSVKQTILQNRVTNEPNET